MFLVVGDVCRLTSVLSTAQRHIRSPSYLFKLAQDAFRHALMHRGTQQPQPPQAHAPSPSSPLLHAALQLGLQVTRLTLHASPSLAVLAASPPSPPTSSQPSSGWRRREVVRWLVSCAVEAGLESLMSLLRTWSGLLTPTEAAGPLAGAALSPQTVARLGLTLAQQEELASCAREIALQCAKGVSYL